MALTNIARRLTAAELAREPRHLGVIAWFDGYGQAGGMGSRAAMEYPRRLTRDEAADWREGWAERRREMACHAAHGFTPCTPEAHDPEGHTA